MDNSEAILDALNPEQCQAVSAPLGHMLVLAGAGSGKTRVLVHRMVWLMSQGVSPFSLLAVTFTNKAANEMRSRIESMSERSMGGLWVGTFHGLAHRVLRAHAQEAGLPESFQIIDSDDQLRLVKRIHKSMSLDEGKWPPKQSVWSINHYKESGLRAKQAAAQANAYANEVVIEVYRAYEAACERSGLVDFGELLLRSVELMMQNESVRRHYQQRFAHILVDEFQDTNTLQYQWLRMFAGEQAFLMAVGDDDQSIYSWRGARVEHLHQFQRDFPDTVVIRLEQNYRSTQTILTAANAVIGHNTERMGKQLWTEGKKGDPIVLYSAFNERDEAFWVANELKRLQRQGVALGSTAILYRSNAQSRILEERLFESQLPYRIYGGLRFFERAEIKDALAYLRLIVNEDDDAAFERVINLPTRGIGNTTLDQIRQSARKDSLSLSRATRTMLDAGQLSGRAATACRGFFVLLEQLATQAQTLSLSQLTEAVLLQSGLLTHYQKDRSERGLSKVENLEELVSATDQFQPVEGSVQSPLMAFLAHVALESGEGQAERQSDSVSLMTLHSAKGLEFAVVFMVGMEEDLFPHKMSSEDPRGLEEERRLCYVGMTRARRQLVMTHAESRRLHGYERYHRPSRFLSEIPAEHIQAVRPTATIRRPSSQVAAPSTRQSKLSDMARYANTVNGFQIGQRVRHQRFGSGTVLSFEGQGDQARVQVRFDREGTKWLVLSYANLVSG